MKGLFKGVFYSRRRKEERAAARVAAPAPAPAMEEVVGGRRSVVRGVGEVGLVFEEMGLHEGGEVGEEEGVGRRSDGDGDGAPMFGAAATVAGRRLTRSSTRVERGEVVTGEGSGINVRRKKLASKRRGTVDIPPPRRESGMYFEAEDVDETRASSVGSGAWSWDVPPSGYGADAWSNPGVEWGGPMRYTPPVEEPEMYQDVPADLTPEEKIESRDLFRGRLPDVTKKFNINAQWQSMRKWWILLKPETKRAIADYGFGDFLSINHMNANSTIVACLVERFRPETNTFAFPECELVLTPEAFARLSGLPSGDRPVNFHTVRHVEMDLYDLFGADPEGERLTLPIVLSKVKDRMLGRVENEPTPEEIQLQ